MRAICLLDKDRFELREMEIPIPQDDQMLIKTGAATICTSDINDIRENPFGIVLPVGLGHEGSGTVAAVGRAVKGFQTGDHVATHPVHPCGRCPACLRGHTHLCQEMGHFGLNMPGTMADYYLVRVDRARRIPDGVDFAVAALAEPVSVCLEALAQARLSPGDSLLVLGDGPFGLIMVRLAVQMSLKRVVLAGMTEFRLAHAGNTPAVNLSGDHNPLKTLMECSSGEGFDAVLLAVGSREAFGTGLLALKPRGRLVVFSAITGETLVDLFRVHIKELEIVGACNDQDRFDEAVEQLSDPVLELDQLITHRFPLEDYRPAFDLAENGKDRALKVAFVF